MGYAEARRVAPDSYRRRCQSDNDNNETRAVVLEERGCFGCNSFARGSVRVELSRIVQKAQAKELQ